MSGEWDRGPEGGGGGGLLDLKLGINCETDRESGSGQLVKVAYTGERSPSLYPSFRGV